MTRRKFVASIGMAAAVLAGLICAEASAQTVAPISSVPGDSTGTTAWTLNNVEVVGILDSFGTNNTLVLQDATGSIVDYHVPTSIYAAPQLGDIIDLTTNNTPYQDGPELLGSSTTGFSLVSTGNLLPGYPVLSIPTVLAASSTSGSASPYGESIVTLDDVHFVSAPTTLANNTTYQITDGTNTMSLYLYKSYGNVGAAGNPNNGLGQLNAAGGGTAPSLNITGYVDNFFGASEFYPLSAVATPEPSSVVLLGIGFFGLAGMLIRRRMSNRVATA